MKIGFKAKDFAAVLEDDEPEEKRYEIQLIC
jgi:hypothetical protein